MLTKVLRLQLCYTTYSSGDIVVRSANHLSEQAEEGKFGRGTSSMVTAVFVSRLLGLLFIIPLQNIIGGYAYGIYYLAYPLYTVMLTLSTAGFPLALSKTISDLSAHGKHKEAGATFRIVGRSMLLFGLGAFLLMWFLGPLYLQMALPHPDTTQIQAALPAIRALAPALIVLPLMSAMRGYLQGYLRFQPSAASQVIEQIARVGVILIGVLIAVELGSGPPVTAAVATFGAVAGAVPAFLLLRKAVIRVRKEMNRKSRYASRSRLKAGHVLWRLLMYSMPIAMGTLILPLSQQIDAWTVPRGLMARGLTFMAATIQYGIYSGEALKLIQLPLSFANAIGVAVLPGLTEALSLGNNSLAKDRLVMTLRMTAFITLPAAAALSILALPLNIALFRSSAGTGAIALAGLISIFSAIELVSTYILQGYDKFYTPVGHMAIGLLIKLALNIILVPIFGINGAAMASVVGYMISSWLNMGAIRRVTGVRVSMPRLSWRTMVATVAAGLWLYAIERLYVSSLVWIPALQQSRLFSLGVVLVGLAIAGPVYLGVALLVRAVNARELSRMPVVGRFFA